jgi:iron complex transport system ATP-binding protein
MTDQALLTASNLSVTLSGRPVLHEVSLSLQRRHLVALVGPNGAGKTTLLRALAGLQSSTGTIHVAGDALASLSLRERAKRFGYLPQGHVVHWPLDVKDVVALGRYPHGATDPARLTSSDKAAVERAMQATDVVAFADRRVTELSGGERSRVALARVLAVEAPIVLADEPTASLDPRYQIDVMTNLRDVANSGVLVMSDGRLAAQGAPRQALSDDIVANVFRISAYRAEHRNETIILPWAGV